MKTEKTMEFTFEALLELYNRAETIGICIEGNPENPTKVSVEMVGVTILEFEKPGNQIGKTGHLTHGDVEDYIKSDISCPYCGSINLTKALEIHDRRQVDCRTCEAIWFERWDMTEIDEDKRSPKELEALKQRLNEVQDQQLSSP